MSSSFAETPDRLGRKPGATCSRTAALVVAALLSGLLAAQPAETVRPEIGKPLLAAQELMKAQRFREALAKVREADAVGGRSAHESFMIERMRIAAASGAGDVETAARAYEIMNGLNRLSAADKVRMLESIAIGHYRAGNHPAAVRSAQRYVAEGGTSAGVRTLLIQSQVLSGDAAGATRELMAEIQAVERSGATPAEDRLRLLLHAAGKAGQAQAYGVALERLVAHHPRPEVWAEVLQRLQRKPGVGDRLTLDVARLAFAVGSMASAAEYMELAQLALQAELPAEGKQVLDKGFATHVLGTGPQAERHDRLRGLVDKRLAERRASSAERERAALTARDGNDLVALGLERVHEGQAARGAQLIEQGIARGGLKRPDQARLHLGIAQWSAGATPRALATFSAITGSDGVAELARLWALHIRRKA